MKKSSMEKSLVTSQIIAACSPPKQLKNREEGSLLGLLSNKRSRADTLAQTSRSFIGNPDYKSSWLQQSEDSSISSQQGSRSHFLPTFNTISQLSSSKMDLFSQKEIQLVPQVHELITIEQKTANLIGKQSEQRRELSFLKKQYNNRSLELTAKVHTFETERRQMIEEITSLKEQLSKKDTALQKSEHQRKKIDLKASSMEIELRMVKSKTRQLLALIELLKKQLSLYQVNTHRQNEQQEEGLSNDLIERCLKDTDQTSNTTSIKNHEIESKPIEQNQDSSLSVDIPTFNSLSWHTSKRSLIDNVRRGYDQIISNLSTVFSGHYETCNSNHFTQPNQRYEHPNNQLQDLSDFQQKLSKIIQQNTYQGEEKIYQHVHHLITGILASLKLNQTSQETILEKIESNLKELKTTFEEKTQNSIERIEKIRNFMKLSDAIIHERHNDQEMKETSILRQFIRPNYRQ